MPMNTTLSTARPSVKRAVQTGQAQAGEVLLSIHENENPLFGLDSVPFLAASYGANKKLWDASRDAIDKVLQYVVSANTAQMDDAAFLAELKSWVRFSAAEAQRLGDGLFSGASGSPVGRVGGLAGSVLHAGAETVPLAVAGRRSGRGPGAHPVTSWDSTSN